MYVLSNYPCGHWEDREESEAIIMKKKAIMSISFGTKLHDVSERNLHVLEADYRADHPDCDLYRVITNESLIKIIQAEGDPVYAVRECMARMVLDGVTHLYVQPAYILNGSEYDELLDMVYGHKADFITVKCGTPLLTNHEDYVRVCKSIMEEDYKNLPANEAVVLVGHGSDHASNSVYCTLDYIFKDLGYEHTNVCTFNAFPQIDTVIRHLQRKPDIDTIHISPFMFVAGEMAMEGVCGDASNSMKSRLEQAGYKVIAHRKCLGEYEGIRKVYRDHLNSCFE